MPSLSENLLWRIFLNYKGLKVLSIHVLASPVFLCALSSRTFQLQNDQVVICDPFLKCLMQIFPENRRNYEETSSDSSSGLLRTWQSWYQANLTMWAYHSERITFPRFFLQSTPRHPYSSSNVLPGKQHYRWSEIAIERWYRCQTEVQLRHDGDGNNNRYVRQRTLEWSSYRHVCITNWKLYGTVISSVFLSSPVKK
ncbi:hypothetical protein ANCCAN_00436 [Ancylostoma caninum]|uniref:Uncharacterized protein n=1 Tax=Ancylostoma caninum TaxID=29170 RepID=A0A368H9T3_ANCCA|nr:hypothetical protein ANCCAN_00436 [Ancylostoma caninum]